MKKTFIFIVLLVSFHSIAQVNMDSLNGVWNNLSKEDTIRWKAKFAMSRQLTSIDVDSALIEFRELLQFSTSLGGKYVPLVIQGIGITYQIKSDFDSALFYANRSIELFEQVNYGRGISMGLINKGKAIGMLGNDSLAMIAFRESAAYSIINSDTLSLIKANGSMAELLNNLGKVTESTRLYEQNYALAQKLNDNNQLAETSRMLATQYYHTNQLRKAIELNSAALKYSEGITDVSIRAGLLNNMGLVYQEIGETEAAATYFNQTAQLFEKIGNRVEMAGAWYNIARMYEDENEIEKSFEYALKSHELFGELHLELGLSYTHNILGELYLNVENYVLAQKHLLKGIESQLKTGENSQLAFMYANLARVYFELGDNHLAIQNAENGLDIAERMMSYHAISMTAEVLHKSYGNIGRYKKAYEMCLLYTNTRDSLNNEEDQKALFRQEYKYQYEKEALADSLVQNEANLKLEFAHQSELSEKNKTRNYLIGAGVLFLVLAGGGWSRAQFVKKANTKLEIERNRAEESERFKQRFLANMSHEIRTPMNAVLGMTELTLDTKLTKKQKVYLEAIKNSSENLLVIINDILDLSKLEQGKLTVEKIPFRLKEQVELVQQTLQYKAEEKGLALEVHLNENVSEVVLGDPSRLHQVLMNLTSNAIKFTEHGKVSILVEQKAGNRILFQVKDTGIGIPKEKQDLLFQSFQQVDESTSRKYGGTGLGLAISKDLIELQGGTISLESEQGKGSTLSFSLELAASESAIEESTKKLEVDTLKGIRILVAEDNTYNQIVILDTLENLIEKAHVTIVENGQLAIDKLEEEDFDVILMDAHMPEMDGVEATKKIRTEGSESKKNIPIIALTASVLNEEIQNCIDAGMNDALPKPFKREELLSVLGQYYSQSKA